VAWRWNIGDRRGVGGMEIGLKKAGGVFSFDAFQVFTFFAVGVCACVFRTTFHGQSYQDPCFYIYFATNQQDTYNILVKFPTYSRQSTKLPVIRAMYENELTLVQKNEA